MAREIRRAKPAVSGPPAFIQKASDILLERWTRCQADSAASGSSGSVAASLSERATSCVNAPEKTYRYVLLTQVLSKVTDPSLDCRCIQVSRGGRGAFDARSLCHKVVVPFDRDNECVLGGSPEPYANNPIRVPEVTAEYRGQQRNKEVWDALCEVLDAVENRDDSDFTDAVFDLILAAIRVRLEGASVTYPVPQRVSHRRLLSALGAYLGERSGGTRLQAVVSALFETIGERFALFTRVRSSNPTASDTSTGQVADVECLDRDDRVALAVEVKDRQLTVAQVSDKLPSVRSARVTEILFIVSRHVRAEESDEADSMIDRQFASGHNMYVFTLDEFASGVLALLGEPGRRDFLGRVGETLDRYRASISDRRAWAALLENL